MRIAIIGSRGFPYVYSGYETLISELSMRLVKRGHEVVVYCHRSLFPLRPRFVEGVELRYVPSIEKKSLSQFTHSLLSVVDVAFSRVDAVLFVNSANGPFGAVLRLARMRSAINVDGLEWLRPKWKGLGSWYFHAASYLATRFFDVVISDSEEMARIYRSEFHCLSVVIAYGADEVYPGQENHITQFGLTTGSYYLVVGRLVPDNNADLIVRELSQSATGRKLVVVGDVPYTDDFATKVKAQANEQTVFTGYVRNQTILNELYCNAFAYIHGHEFGGTNPSLLKGLGCGCAVLALDTKFNREVLLGEKHGRYFTKSPGSLAMLVSSIENNEEVAKQLHSTARERIREAYTWESITDKYESMLAGLCR